MFYILFGESTLWAQILEMVVEVLVFVLFYLDGSIQGKIFVMPQSMMSSQIASHFSHDFA